MITTLILPAYNEEKYIADIVHRARGVASRVIVVDNNSTDNTYQIANDAGAIILRHCYNLGKAGSLKTGCEAALRLGTDFIAFMDSDGQHKPEDLPRFIELLEKEDLDIVIGCRSGGDRMPLVRKTGNQLLRYAVRFLFNVHVDDVQSGFRIFRADVYSRLKWKSTGSSHYFADAEMTTRIGRNHLNYRQLPIETIFNDKHKGMTPIQGLHLFSQLFLWRLFQ